MRDATIRGGYVRAEISFGSSAYLLETKYAARRRSGLIVAPDAATKERLTSCGSADVWKEKQSKAKLYSKSHASTPKYFKKKKIECGTLGVSLDKHCIVDMLEVAK